MKLILGTLIVGALLIVSCSPKGENPSQIDASDSYTGSEGGGGGDVPTYDYESTWFQGGDKTISYCIQGVSPDFGTAGDTIKPTIEKAFKIWNDYIQLKDHLDSPGAIEWRPASQIKFQNICDGTEDLKFYFGITSKEVDRAKKKYSNPAEMAERTEFDTSATWGKGFIWIGSKWDDLSGAFGNDWDKGNNLLGALLHEIGHVLGCGHVSGTIMRADYNKLIRGPLEPKAQGQLGAIDYDRELISNFYAHNSYDDLRTHNHLHDPAAVFKMFTGKTLNGKLKIKLNLNWFVGFPKDASVTLIDDNGPNTFDFALNVPGSSTVESESVVFKTIDGARATSSSNLTYRFSLFPQIKSATGKVINANLTYNDGKHPLILWIYDDSEDSPEALYLLEHF
jgi:hypothetical protein